MKQEIYTVLHFGSGATELPISSISTMLQKHRIQMSNIIKSKCNNEHCNMHTFN